MSVGVDSINHARAAVASPEVVGFMAAKRTPRARATRKVEAVAHRLIAGEPPLDRARSLWVCGSYARGAPDVGDVDAGQRGPCSTTSHLLTAAGSLLRDWSVGLSASMLARSRRRHRSRARAGRRTFHNAGSPRSDRRWGNGLADWVYVTVSGLEVPVQALTGSYGWRRARPRPRPVF